MVSMDFQVKDQCVLCGARTLSLWFQGKEEVWNSCDRCGLRFVNPWPVVPAKTLYTDIFDTPVDTSHTPDTRGTELEQSFEYAVLHLRSGGNRLLDVGCHNGSFLVRMRQRGWEVVGIDASIKPVEYARRVHRLKVYHGGVEDLPLDIGCFDMITIWEIVEHMTTPLKSLETVKRLLSPGGIVAISMPNGRSWVANAAKEAWEKIYRKDHIALYSPKTVRYLGKMLSLETCQVRTEGIGLETIRQLGGGKSFPCLERLALEIVAQGNMHP